jgi:hypothetical protein
MTYAKEDAEHFNIWQSTRHDVIALLWTLINKVCISYCHKRDICLSQYIDPCIRPLSAGV